MSFQFSSGRFSISSSKSGSVSVDNNKVVFSDGSWVDTNTGTGVNCGRGSITVNGRELGKDGLGNAVEPTAPHKETINDLRHLTVVADSSNVVIVSQGSSLLKGDQAVVEGVFSCTENNGYAQVIQEESTPLNIVVTAGVQVRLALEGIAGADLKGTFNDLAVSASGSTSADIDKTQGSAKIDISGSSSVDITEVVDGQLQFNVSGTSSLNVDSGNIELLSGSATGASGVQCQAMAQMADLTASGVSKIKCAHVVSQPMTRVTGVASIKVRNW